MQTAIQRLKEEIRYLKKAVALAKKGKGWVNSNPMVGAILVKDGRIIGQGYHEYFGGPHAEVNAIRNATESVAGATMYVSLEPCSHHGKTPPCTDLIIRGGIKRVVAAMADPNPLVHGKGLNALRDAGVEVELTEIADAVELNEIFVSYIHTGRPFCTLKTAMTLDGKTATVTNASRWISGKKSRSYVHELRQEHAAVMVGIDTVVSDDPLLNTRRKGKRNRNPLKIIVDSTGRITPAAKVLSNDPQLTIIATTDKIEPVRKQELERTGAQLLVCPQADGRVDLNYLMDSLGKMGVDSVLLEGGSRIAFSALAAGIVNKVVTFVAPMILGGKEAPTPVGGKGFPFMENAIPVQRWRCRKMGDDLLIEGYI